MSETTQRRAISGNSIASLVAVLISMSALAVSILDTTTQRSESRAAVWPHISIGGRYDSEGFRLAMINNGVGPARVRWSSFKLDGEPITDLDQSILDTVGAEMAFSYDVYLSGSMNQGVLASGDDFRFFYVPWEDRTRALVAAWSGRVSIEVCYCSVYDDCWIARLEGGDPQPVRECSGTDEV